MVGSLPILDMVVAILSYPMMHVALYAGTDIIGSIQAQILSQAVQDTTVCIDRDQIVSTRYRGPFP